MTSPVQTPHAMASGWYWAEGDPFDSVRYWDGSAWASDSQPLQLPPEEPAGLSHDLVNVISSISIAVTVMLTLAWISLIALWALLGSLVVLARSADEPMWLDLPSWFNLTWCYPVILPIAILGIIFGNRRRHVPTLIASGVFPIIPVAIGYLAMHVAL